MKQKVACFADGAAQYIRSMKRLEMSLIETNFDGVFQGFNDYNAIESKHHLEVPYQFKAKAIKKAMESDCDLLLWADSAIYASKNIQPIFDHIKEHGYIFFDNIGYTIADHTSDNCLEKFGVSRLDAYGSKMIMACLMGFDLNHPEAKEFLRRYIEASEDGVSFHGPWNNFNLGASKDIRCMGHRHDQSVASLIIKDMGLTITNAQETFFCYAEHKGKLQISDSVCMWSAGMS